MLIHVRDPDEHDLGLQHDLTIMAARMAVRRRVLGYMLSGGAAALVAGCGGGGGSDATTTAGTGAGTSTGTGTSPGTTGTSSGSSLATCTPNSTETAGPYPSDGSNGTSATSNSNSLVTTGVVRSDIRSSFGGIGSSVATGVPLSITLNLFNTNNNCSALANAAVYLWHCTADGNYSLYSNGVMNENYLRGVQVSNASGQVTFLSIFPGCYSGRYPHIHFEIYQTLGMATQYRNAILTSQMALPRDVCTTVYSGGAPGYAASLSNLASVQVTTDNVFGDNTTAQITAMTPATTGSVAAGYNALIAVGVAVS